MTADSKALALGALAGALAGLIGRPFVVAAFWLSGDHKVETNVVLITAMVACVIGLVVGAVAGVIAADIRGTALGCLVGAAVGGALAYAISLLTFLLLCIGTWTGQPRDVNPIVYGAMIALSGALPGIAGGLVARWARGLPMAGKHPEARRDEPLDESGDWSSGRY